MIERGRRERGGHVAMEGVIQTGGRRFVHTRIINMSHIAILHPISQVFWFLVKLARNGGVVEQARKKRIGFAFGVHVEQKL